MTYSLPINVTCKQTYLILLYTLSFTWGWCNYYFKLETDPFHDQLTKHLFSLFNNSTCVCMYLSPPVRFHTIEYLDSHPVLFIASFSMNNRSDFIESFTLTHQLFRIFFTLRWLLYSLVSKPVSRPNDALPCVGSVLRPGWAPGYRRRVVAHALRATLNFRRSTVSSCWLLPLRGIKKPEEISATILAMRFNRVIIHAQRL